jgi:1-acyl-sn-glycerol-3-phosphate acyltransferase
MPGTAEGQDGSETVSDRTPLLYRTLHTVLVPVLNALYRPTVEGVEHIPDEGPAILASNHLSFLDSIFLPAAIDRPIFFLGKTDYFSGWRRHFFENVGVMPVNRQGGDAGEASLRRGNEVLGSGRLLGIYPEGTRSPDGRLYRGKTGPVRLALRTGTPIIPVAMLGTFEVLPSDARVPRLSKVGVRVGAPLSLSRYADREHDRFALRSATDELMYELMLLSGQEYVDAYADQVKSGEVDLTDARFDELGQLLDDDLLRRAS